MQRSDFGALVGPAYTYPSLPVDCQECINFECFKIDSTHSPYKGMLISTAGTKKLKFRDKATGAIYSKIPSLPGATKDCIRGLHRCPFKFRNDDYEALIVVSSNGIWKVSPPDAENICELQGLGTISGGTTKVFFTDTVGETLSKAPSSVVIVDGVTMYIINSDYYFSTGLSTVLEIKPTSVGYLDGRTFICGISHNDGETQRIYWSAINDATSWNALDFVSAAVNADPLKALCVVGNYLWALGTESYEIWQTTSSSGTLYSPIRKVTGVNGGVGTCSVNSIAQIANSLFFVGGGSTGRLRIYEGSAQGSINVISTDAMSQEFASYKKLDDSSGMCWADDGQIYYAITFPSEDTTWVYNINQKLWHKRSSTRETVPHKWRISSITDAFGTVVGGDIETGELYLVSKNFNDDDGTAIVRRRVAPHLKNNGKLLNHMSLEIDLECGNALPYGQGSDPKIMLRALDGGGRIKREPRWKSSGTQGMYRRRVKWYRLGTSADRCYEICVSDPIKWTFYGAVLETEDNSGGR